MRGGELPYYRTAVEQGGGHQPEELVVDEDNQPQLFQPEANIKDECRWTNANELNKP